MGGLDFVFDEAADGIRDHPVFVAQAIGRSSLAPLIRRLSTGGAVRPVKIHGGSPLCGFSGEVDTFGHDTILTQARPAPPPKPAAYFFQPR